jgi:serpin B
MGLAFSVHADFTGLSPQAARIGFIQHAATLEVAEKGTIASAATAVGVVATAGHSTLAFNRPYLLMLRDSLTGEPLMLAWVADPASR